MFLSYFRTTTPILLFICVFVGGAAAQAPPAPPAAPQAPPASTPAPSQNLTVMVVDYQALLQNSKAAKMVRSQIEGKRGEYTKEISHQEEVLRAERDALQRQQASLSPEALNQKMRDFQQKVNELERNVQGKRQALEKSNGDARITLESCIKIARRMNGSRYVRVRHFISCLCYIIFYKEKKSKKARIHEYMGKRL